MQVLYQIPGDVARGPLGRSELDRRRSLLQQWASPATHVEVSDAPGGPLSIESHAEEVLCVPPMIRTLQADTRTHDAVTVGCFGDPGVAALREILDCPVIGPFEASMHVAAQLGARVGVVTILDRVVPVLDHLVGGMGLSLRYAGATAIDTPVLELRDQAAQVAERIADAAGPLVSRHGADLLILGCMSLAFLGMAEQTSERIGIPVVNPARCALKTAESLVAQALVQSRRTYAKPRKPIIAVQ